MEKGFNHRKYTKRWIRTPYRDNRGEIKLWLNRRNYHKYFNLKVFLKNLLLVIILLILFIIIYSNIENLNETRLWFIRLGTGLIIVNLIFLIKYSYRLLKGISYWFKDQKNLIKLIIIIILIIILFFSYSNRDDIKNIYNKEIKTKLSKELEQNKVTLKVDLDSFGSTVDSVKYKVATYIPKTSLERESDCKGAFVYLNNIRKQYGRNKLEWDNRAYNLAVARAKDMYERDYFDHITPEGKCAKDFKSVFGFKDFEVLAENVGGMTYYETGGVVGNCKEAVDGWLDSRGHRYNLLYYSHISGAIGCYSQICVFYGINDIPNGFGSGPCNTGTEGLMFWKSAGKQEREI